MGRKYNVVKNWWQNGTRSKAKDKKFGQDIASVVKDIQEYDSRYITIIDDNEHKVCKKPSKPTLKDLKEKRRLKKIARKIQLTNNFGEY